MEVYRRLFTSLLRSKDNAIRSSQTPKLMELLKVAQVENRLMLDAISFTKKIRNLASQNPETEDKNSSKLGRHAKRCLWLIRNERKTSRLEKVESGDAKNSTVRKTIVTEWNSGTEGKRRISWRRPRIH